MLGKVCLSYQVVVNLYSIITSNSYYLNWDEPVQRTVYGLSKACFLGKTPFFCKFFSFLTSQKNSPLINIPQSFVRAQAIKIL